MSELQGRRLGAQLVYLVSLVSAALYQYGEGRYVGVGCQIGLAYATFAGHSG